MIDNNFLYHILRKHNILSIYSFSSGKCLKYCAFLKNGTKSCCLSFFIIYKKCTTRILYFTIVNRREDWYGNTNAQLILILFWLRGGARVHTFKDTFSTRRPAVMLWIYSEKPTKVCDF